MTDAARLQVVEAINAGNIPELEELLKGIEAVDFRVGSTTPLISAIKSTTCNSIEMERMVRLLLAAGASPNYGNAQATRSPLSALFEDTVSTYQLPMLRVLLAAGVDINKPVDSHGNTALHCASSAIQPATVRALLDGKANFHAKNEQGETPLHAAVGHSVWHARLSPQHEHAVEMLLNAGASVHERNRFGDTPLHCYAKIAGGFWFRKIGELLLSHGADPNARNLQGQTPLHIAALHKGSTCAVLVLYHGADINVADNAGTTPRMLPGWQECMKYQAKLEKIT